MATLFPTFQRLALPWHTTRSQSQSLLRLIATAIEENVPLSPLLEAWAEDERGVQQRRVQRLARLIAAGQSLADAVESVPHVLGDEDLLAIRYDAKLGLRTAAVREAIGSAPTAGRTGVRHVTLYIGAVLPLVALIVTFIHVKIVPVLTLILFRSDLEFPPVAQGWLQFLETIADYLLPALLVALLLIWLAFALPFGRRVRRAIVSRVGAPSSAWIAADVLQKISLALQAGRPIAGVLSTLARYHFDPRMRGKLLFVRNEVEQGADVWQSLTAIQLLAAPELRLMEASDRVGNRPWALSQLADVRKSRSTRRGNRFRALLMPAMVVAIGLIVLFQALTVFVPLTQIVESMGGGR